MSYEWARYPAVPVAAINYPLTSCFRIVLGGMKKQTILLARSGNGGGNNLRLRYRFLSFVA